LDWILDIYWLKKAELELYSFSTDVGHGKRTFLNRERQRHALVLQKRFPSYPPPGFFSFAATITYVSKAKNLLIIYQ